MIPFIYENQSRTIPPLCDNISPYYIIYTSGDIFSIKTNKYLTPQLTDTGYLQVHLNTTNGSVHRKVHRLVLLTFCYFYGCEQYQVNHKDGNKFHNYIWNLEWMLPNENVRHAIQNKLREPFKGSYNPNAKISEDTAKEIINMLLFGYSDIAISNTLGVSVSIIQQIARGNTWTYLTNNVIDQLKKTRVGYKLTEQQYHQLCLFYQNNKDKYASKFGGVKQMVIDALHNINVFPNDTFIRIAKRLYYRYDKPNITCLYNY